MRAQISSLDSRGISVPYVHVRDYSEQQFQDILVTKGVNRFFTRTSKGNLTHQLQVTPLLLVLNAYKLTLQATQVELS